VEAWRKQQSLRRTLERRPDLLEHVELNKKELKWLQEIKKDMAQEKN